MSIRVTFNCKDGSHFNESGGCFGCLGRLDSHAPREEFEKDISTYQKELTGRGTYIDGSRPSWSYTKKEIESVEINSDSLRASAILAPECRDWLRFIMSLFPYAFLSGEEEWLKGKVLISPDAAADDFITVLFLCRAPAEVFYKGCEKIITAVKGSDVPDYFKLVYCLAFSSTVSGASTKHGVSLNKGDGTMFESIIASEFFEIANGERDLPRCPASFAEAGGYPMTIQARWGSWADYDDGDQLGNALRGMSNKLKLTKVVDLSGHFLKRQPARIIPDHQEAITKLWNLFKETYSAK